MTYLCNPQESNSCVGMRVVLMQEGPALAPSWMDSSLRAGTQFRPLICFTNLYSDIIIFLVLCLSGSKLPIQRSKMKMSIWVWFPIYVIIWGINIIAVIN